jgi:uncharacterized protein
MNRTAMNLEQIQAYAPKLKKIAKNHGISKVFLTGSVARGDSSTMSDIDFLVELDPDASLFGVAGFLYEAEQLLGVSVDVVPLGLLSVIDDRNFVDCIQKDAIVL